MGIIEAWLLGIVTGINLSIIGNYILRKIDGEI